MKHSLLARLVAFTLITVAVFILALGHVVRKAAEERTAAEAVLKLGGSVLDDNDNSIVKDNPPLVRNQQSAFRTAIANVQSKGSAKSVTFPIGTHDDKIKLILSFSSLHHLNLEQAAVTDSVIATITNANGLVSLKLRSTLISDEGVKHLPALRQLQFLDLSHTKITDKSAIELAKCSQLRHLYLEDTFVSLQCVSRLKNALPQANISWFPATSEVELDTIAECERAGARCYRMQAPPTDTKWVVVITHKVANMQALVPLSQVPHVDTVRIFGRKLDHRDLDFVVGIANVRAIHLIGVDFDENDLERVAKCTNLEELNLDSSTVSGHGLSYLSRIRKLRSLGLHGTKVSDDGVKHLANIPSLANIDLSSTAVSNRCILFLNALPDLRKINLSDTKVEDVAIAQLLRRDQVEVVRDRSASKDALP